LFIATIFPINNIYISKGGLDESSPYNSFIKAGYLYILKGGLDKSSPYRKSIKPYRR
jgi:hypothetical protein